MYSLFLLKLCCRFIRFVFAAVVLDIESLVATFTERTEDFCKFTSSCCFNLQELHFQLHFNFCGHNLPSDTHRRHRTTWFFSLSKLRCSIKSHNSERDNGIALPNQIVIAVAYNSSSSLKNYSKPKITLLKSFCSSMHGISKLCTLSDSVSWNWYTLSEKTGLFCSLQTVSCLLSFLIENITRWETITFEKSNEIGDKTNVIFVTYQPHSVGIDFCACFCKLSIKSFIHNINVIEEKTI